MNPKSFNTSATHPLQSFAWGEFRKSTGVTVERFLDHDKPLQLTIHQLPHLPYTIGYLPRSHLPSAAAFTTLRHLANRYRSIFIKLEPNLFAPIGNKEQLLTHQKFLLVNGCIRGRPLFTDYSFHLDLTKSEAELLGNLKPKTRYNLRLAQKKGVVVSVDNSDQAFETYISLWKETTKRQRFFAHTETYQRKMWQFMRKNNIAHLLKATYQNQTLVTWIVFVFNHVLYYPYGASSNLHRDTMASNLMMWETIRFGKTMGCKLFDMWGALGPNPNLKDPWYGFHRFKLGYGATLVEFVGSFDFIINRPLYNLYRLADPIRWWILRRYSARY
ncbi:hypothetical protein A2783_01485 [Microgenomates group bacterium RIFCSPHIGHO2_01_FULL_45_11]|nr:MAG: hypothetical protein A2783_01485 [Microgenomates group bacterium RIFCSPHIGHO2_01_FULL_45_11]